MGGNDYQDSTASAVLLPFRGILGLLVISRKGVSSASLLFLGMSANSQETVLAAAGMFSVAESSPRSVSRPIFNISHILFRAFFLKLINPSGLLLQSSQILLPPKIFSVFCLHCSTSQLPVTSSGSSCFRPKKLFLTKSYVDSLWLVHNKQIFIQTVLFCILSLSLTQHDRHFCFLIGHKNIYRSAASENQIDLLAILKRRIRCEQDFATFCRILMHNRDRRTNATRSSLAYKNKNNA